MTKEEAIHCIEILKALIEGKKIEMNINGNWVGELTLDNSHTDYFNLFIFKDCRIKTNPKYIPYTWEDWKEFMGKEIKATSDGSIVKITGLNRECIIRLNRTNEEWASPYRFMFEHYTHLDGTTFGKLVEE